MLSYLLKSRFRNPETEHVKIQRSGISKNKISLHINEHKIAQNYFFLLHLYFFKAMNDLKSF